MAYMEDFPACCTASVIVGFGESQVAEDGGFAVDASELAGEIRQHIKAAKRWGCAMLTATTNNEQKTANKVLKECGFKRTRWMTKKAHPETKVCLWWIQLDQV